MQPHQQRVVDEKAALDVLLTALGKFIGSDEYAALDSEERRRLRLQCDLMGEYSAVLGQRIAAFPPDVPIMVTAFMVDAQGGRELWFCRGEGKCTQGADNKQKCPDCFQPREDETLAQVADRIAKGDA